MKRPRESHKGTGNSRSGGSPSRGRKRTVRRNRRQPPSRPIRVVGIVGGIGSGKSHVAERLASRGATVIDADAVGHALLDQGPIQEILVRRFGPDLLGPPDEDGVRRIDRGFLGSIVFRDEASRKILEDALHPRMRSTFERVISRLSRQVSPKPGSLRLPAPVVVLDAAVLYEAGWENLCDTVVFVDASRKDRLKRLKEQRGWAPDELDRREAAQWPLDLKKQKANVVLKNSEGSEDGALEKDLDKLWTRVNPSSAVVTPRKARGEADLNHLIEDEIDVTATERPKKRRKGPGRPPAPPRK